MSELSCSEIKELFEMIAESYRSTKMDEYGTSTPISKVMHYKALLDNLHYAIEYPDMVRGRITVAKRQKKELALVMSRLNDIP